MGKYTSPKFSSPDTTGTFNEESSDFEFSSDPETPKSVVYDDYNDSDCEFEELVQLLTSEELASADQEFSDLIGFHGCPEIELRIIRQQHKILKLMKEQYESAHSQQIKGLMQVKLDTLKELEAKEAACEAEVVNTAKLGTECEKAVDLEFQPTPSAILPIKPDLKEMETKVYVDENNNAEPPVKTLTRRRSVKDMVSAFEEKAKEQFTSHRSTKRFSSKW